MGSPAGLFLWRVVAKGDKIRPMPLKDLNPSEMDILRRCMTVAATDSSVFPDWEMHAIFGLDRDEVISIFDKWPDLDETNSLVVLAINNTLNNLLGYPHKHHKDWNAYFTFSKNDVMNVYTKWRGTLPEGCVRGMM